MAYGRLGVASLATTANTTIYTVPSTCKYAELSVYVLNGQVTDATVEIAIAQADTPVAGEYIEKGVIIPMSGGSLETTGHIVSPGERIVVKSSVTGLNVRVQGKEITKV